MIKLLGEVGAEIVDRRIRRGRVGAQRAYAVRLIIQEPECPAGGIYGTLLGMVMSDQAPKNQIRLEVGPALGDVELNELFGASWPDHRPASFSGMLARSLCWVTSTDVVYESFFE
ncbi:hypothetical protein ACGFI3_44395 [Nonomuraea wenchangensis]|uniref:hypothetical protein n=1 Tax=Nonomuraea wenchangensis TaxID=568860 RepID=UPI003713C22D